VESSPTKKRKRRGDVRRARRPRLGGLLDIPDRAPPRCSTCNGVGHYARTCSQPHVKFVRFELGEGGKGWKGGKDGKGGRVTSEDVSSHKYAAISMGQGFGGMV
jgi:hypothetical protein